MSEVRMCPSCAKELEFDSFSGRYVCPECGRSEAANTGVDLHVSVPKSTDIPSVTIEKAPAEVPVAAPEKTQAPTEKRHYSEVLEMPTKEEVKPEKKKEKATSEKLAASFVPTSAEEKNEPAEVLRSFYKEFECASVEEALFRAEDSMSEEYLDQISTHPLVSDLAKAQPKGSLSKNIVAYCDKVRHLIRAEAELRASQKDLEKAEEYVQKLRENEARHPKSKRLFSWEVIVTILGIPLAIVFAVFFDDDDDRLPLTAENINLTFKVIGIMYLIVFAVMLIIAVISHIRNSKKEGDKMLETKRAHITDTMDRALKIQDEKEQILKAIRSEEASIREKYMKRTKR